MNQPYSQLTFPFLSFPMQTRNYIRVYIDNPLSPNENELQYIDYRCTIEEINDIKCHIHSSRFYRKLIVIIPLMVLLVISIPLIMMIPKLDQENRIGLISLSDIVIIVSMILILRKVPPITRKMFYQLNDKLMDQNIIFVLPSDKEYERTSNPNPYFELWKKEEFDMVQKSMSTTIFIDPEAVGRYPEFSRRASLVEAVKKTSIKL